MMARIVRLNNYRGFTLVEVLVAMVVVLVVLMGLVQTALVSIDGNLRNLFRDEAVRLVEQRLNGMIIDDANNQYLGLRTLPFDDAGLVQTAGWTCTSDTGAEVPRTFRDMTKNYNVCWRITDITTDIKRLEVAAGWNYRNENPLLAPTNREFQHSITSILRRPPL
jgi:prepilin-type N-terminal cleavage/methylation domain-containing protein